MCVSWKWGLTLHILYFRNLHNCVFGAYTMCCAFQGLCLRMCYVFGLCMKFLCITVSAVSVQHSGGSQPAPPHLSFLLPGWQGQGNWCWSICDSQWCDQGLGWKDWTAECGWMGSVWDEPRQRAFCPEPWVHCRHLGTMGEVSGTRGGYGWIIKFYWAGSSHKTHLLHKNNILWKPNHCII